MLVGMNWIQKTKVIVIKEEMKFNVLKNEILEWLKDLKEVFRTISKEELSFHRYEMDYEITLRIKKIKSLLLISIRSKKQESVKEYLNEMTRKEWIKISKSLIIVFLFLIFKLETDKKRPVIDYRKLNKEIVTDSTSLSLIRDMIDQIKEQKYFIKIDLKDVFNQIRIREEDEWKTIFRTRYETFEYLVMSFGLINVSTTFQRFVN